MEWAITALAAYILGSIPFGLVMAKLFGLGDIRQIGSGNIGATNVLRTGNKLAAFLTVVFDAGKGAAAVLIARMVFDESAAGFAGLFAVIGHMFPIFLKFKGGKGVATFLGTLLALSFPAGLAACAAWLVAAVLFRISSLSAILAAALAPVFTFYFYHMHGAVLVAILSIIVIAKHHQNIGRLMKGEEPKIGKK